MYQSTIYLCIIINTVYLLMALSPFLKATMQLLFLWHFLRRSIEKNCLCSTDEIVKCVIFCYTMDTNKLYDTKTNPSFCYCCLCIFYDCATTVIHSKGLICRLHQLHPVCGGHRAAETTQTSIWRCIHQLSVSCDKLNILRRVVFYLF